MTPPPTESLRSAPHVDRAQLITDHVPMVTHVVRETMTRVPGHVSRDDLTSAGLMALVQAATAFDPERGVPFAGYAAQRVRGAVLDELRGIDWASRSVRRTARSIERTRTELAGILGRVPTTDEVARALGLTVEEITRNDDDAARAQVLSLHASEDADLEALVPSAGPTPDQVIEHRERLGYMMAAVSELPERLRVVVEDYFLAERPMREIAERLNVSESRVSQMRAEALTLMREAMHRGLHSEPYAAPDHSTGCAARRRESYYAAVAARHASTGRTVAHHRLDRTA